MKIQAIAIIVLAVLIAAVPQFTDCHSQGKMLTLQNGKQIDMKCHWTAEAALVTALPIAAVGLMMGFSKRKEPRNLAITGAALGAGVVLLPLAAIGVCSSPAMLCNSLMQPALVSLGTLVGLVSLSTLVKLPGRAAEQAA